MQCKPACEALEVKSDQQGTCWTMAHAGCPKVMVTRPGWGASSVLPSGVFRGLTRSQVSEWPPHRGLCARRRMLRPSCFSHMELCPWGGRTFAEVSNVISKAGFSGKGIGLGG